MRRARDAEFIMNGEIFVGINLGADFVAEHEWGISDIKGVLGVPVNVTMSPELHGIKGRTVTKFPSKDFFFQKKKTHTCLTFEANSFNELRGWKNSELDSKPEKLATAWSGRDFGIVVANEYAGYLQELFEAFQRCDVVIGLGGTTNPFQNAGLSIAIASRFPKDIDEILKVADEDHRQLLLVVEATGIEKRLKAAGKRYFALSPRWKDETKKEVEFWLNPHEQDKDNYGWFTVRDLDLWIEGKGKIPKRKK